MKPKLPKDSRGYNLDLAEPYVDDDGIPSVAAIWNGHHLKLKTIEEWKKDEPELGEYFEKEYFLTNRHLWVYPGKPLLPENYEEVRRLHIDIQRCNDEYIEFPNSACPSVFATWLMGSYLAPFLPRYPILLIFGVTASGKGQVADQVDRLAYRGKKLISPTQAILYRLADRWSMTLALDEAQDLDKDSYKAVLSIIKGSYDKTLIFRCDSNNREVEAFQPRGFMALSLKGTHPPEDIKNRGILFTMQQNGTPKSLVPEDSEEHRELRARLIGLRLKMLMDPQFSAEASRKVQELGTPEALGFDRRPRDIALSLLLPAVMSGQQDELIEIIRKSYAEARDENNSTFPAKVHHCYEDLVESNTNPPRFFPVLAIKSNLIEEMRADGELRDNEKISTKKVTDALKTLGYGLVRKTGNNPFIDREDKQNILAFETNQKKYAIGDVSKGNH